MHSNPVTSDLVAAAMDACSLQPEALNSERIAQRFASYGIEVLAYRSGVRRSNLYSLEGDIRICRTYAVVRFADELAPSVTTAHAEILAGKSIGARFRSGGWEIRKATLHLGVLALKSGQQAIAKLMRLDAATELAMHAYRLTLQQGTQSIDYATIVEVHHPDYLPLAELTDLYGASNANDVHADAIGKLTALVLDAHS